MKFDSITISKSFLKHCIKKYGKKGDVQMEYTFKSGEVVNIRYLECAFYKQKKGSSEWVLIEITD